MALASWPRPLLTMAQLSAPLHCCRVQVERGILTLSAHPAPRCNCRECNPFALPPLSKSFRLGPHIDANAVTARFDGGVLTVRMPRKVQPRRIIIASAAAACPVAPVYCAPPAAWVPPHQACFAQPATACVAVPAPPRHTPKPAAPIPQTSSCCASPSEPKQQVGVSCLPRDLQPYFAGPAF